MTEKQEIRARSMELALQFMGLINKLPITNELADERGYAEQELDRVFKGAVEWAKKFEGFILKASPE